MNFETLSFTL